MHRSCIAVMNQFHFAERTEHHIVVSVWNIPHFQVIMGKLLAAIGSLIVIHVLTRPVCPTQSFYINKYNYVYSHISGAQLTN